MTVYHIGDSVMDAARNDRADEEQECEAGVRRCEGGKVRK